MTLGQLKDSLSKLPNDMNDMEVIIQYSIKNKDIHENLCFTGYWPVPDHESIILGTLSALQKLVEEGKAEKPEGYISPKKKS